MARPSSSAAAGFILGSSRDDLSQAGAGSDYLEGGAGNAIIHGFSARDKPVLTGMKDTGNHDYRGFARQVKGGIVFDFSTGRVILADPDMSVLTQAQIILT